MTANNSPEHFVLGVEAAVRVGNDTDTVAAIAGGLLGARWGYSAIPQSWLELVHGWPGLKAQDLVHLADEITEPIWG
jgi:ADP-ribosylglycohydrolase